MKAQNDRKVRAVLDIVEKEGEGKMIHLIMDSINYMEERLDQPLQIEEVAEAACMSKFHYQRLFHMLTGIAVAEYIRKRRLTLAAEEFMTKQVKVIDAAVKYGYETPESFAKAFKRHHGYTPAAVKTGEYTVKAYPRLSFELQIKGVEPMHYRIVEKDSFLIMGRRLKTTTKNSQNKQDIPAFWKRVNQEGWTDSLAHAAGELGYIGVCAHFDETLETFDYIIGIEQGEEEPDSTMTVEQIPASTWAVFQSKGPVETAVHSTWTRIFTEWFPASGYEHAGGMEMETYPLDGEIHSPDHVTLIWIPIRKQS